MASSTTKQEMFEQKKVKKKMSKAQMQLAIIKKKQCDAKALGIVEQLLEHNIDSEWLLNNLRYINKSHMEDVIEERAIIKLCGYVLCNNALTAVITQQYHISMKKNKVYDVTRRKNFCSSHCYGACNYLLEQMLTSPLWLRDKEEIPVFKILSKKDKLRKSTPGDEIIVRDADIVSKSASTGKTENVNEVLKNSGEPLNESSEIHTNNEYDALENSQTANEFKEIIADIEALEIVNEQLPKDSDEKLKYQENESTDSENLGIKQYVDDNVNDNSTPDKCLLNHTATQDIKELNKDISMNEVTDQQQKDDEEENKLLEASKTECDTTVTTQDININKTNHVQKKEKSETKKHKQKNPTKEKQPSEFYNLAMRIENNVKEWLTEDTITLLSGEQSIKNQLLENIMQHDRYLHLCKKLNKLQLEDEKDDRADLAKNTLKPLPHLSVLQEEGKKMELKVRAFFKGDMAIETPAKTTEDTNEDNEHVTVLPLTEAQAPKALRRRIFLDKLNRILPDLLRALASSKLPQHLYSSERNALIKALISTFSLSATNIIFKTAEWTLVGLIIIKMLSMIDPQLKVILSTRQASMYISMILMSYKLDSNYLDRLLMELTNDTKIHDIDNTTNF
ncbi:putative RNA polymerase II subunit B1 CTD phosphatase RPAP2 isoform X1 [Calliopsis andreniformis]|uniref:putative RNA polymerase II subunit B1 CTD phosphatase RPAP2 isoform X1 n=3 Tax=Calliopsis andreniformis TaxID=337506 RepID=UPI003FCE25D9